jgi:hypothetical protein
MCVVFLSKESMRWKRLPILMGMGLGWNEIYLERRVLILFDFIEFSSYVYGLPKRTAKPVVDCVWNVMARAETRFRLSAKRTSSFKSARGRQFSRLLAAEGCASAVVNAGYTMFRGSVKGIGYPLHSPVSPSFLVPASPCAITFQLDSTADVTRQWAEQYLILFL